MIQGSRSELVVGERFAIQGGSFVFLAGRAQSPRQAMRTRSTNGWENIDAAWDDPVFDQVTETETQHVELDLSVLTERQRFVVERAWGLGGNERPFSYREIAESMGIHWSTVKEHHDAALNRLRETPTPST